MSVLRRWPSQFLIGALLLLGAACHPQPGRTAHPFTHPPRELQGRFLDDYDNRYEISDSEWVQLPHGRFHIVQWRLEEQYLLAWNDSANSYDPGKWTRIDWMPFEDLAPYTWGFCLTAFSAANAEAAAGTAPPNRETPKTGCNGYPFSRMRPDTVTPGGT